MKSILLFLKRNKNKKEKTEFNAHFVPRGKIYLKSEKVEKTKSIL